jgi:hypothetical protein
MICIAASQLIDASEKTEIQVFSLRRTIHDPKSAPGSTITELYGEKALNPVQRNL